MPGSAAGSGGAAADSGATKTALGRRGRTPLFSDSYTADPVTFTLDPTVLSDDDGQAHLHYGGFGRMLVAKLASDKHSIDGKLREASRALASAANSIVQLLETQHGLNYGRPATGIASPSPSTLTLRGSGRLTTRDVPGSRCSPLMKRSEAPPLRAKSPPPDSPEEREYKGRILDALPGALGQDALTSHPAVAEYTV